ncbi:MAG: hypothetical protein ACRCV9_16300 [Burkholderiaceae bacterium]
MRKLAEEIAAVAGSNKDADVSAIETWLLDGNDDGSDVAELWHAFDAEVGLPSRQEN